IPNLVTSIGYDAAGRTTSQSNFNGTTTTQTYSAQRAWINGITTLKSTTTIQNLGYSRDNEGKILTITSPVGNEGWTHAYDDLHELTSSTNTTTPSTYTQTFNYDGTVIGNITQKVSGGTTSAFTYPASGASSVRPHGVTQMGSNVYAY